MFIYRITVGDKHYYGMDTKPTYKQHRWKTHCREAMNPLNTNPLHTAMREAGIENCIYEVIEEGFETLPQLGAAEIQYIADNDTYQNGLNSSPGGDGLGHHNLYELDNEEISVIKQTLSSAMSEYNTKVKWAYMSSKERKEATSHLHNDDVYQRKSATLKEFYARNPDVRKEKFNGIAKWRKQNQDQHLENVRRASLLGAAKISKKVKIEFADGNIKVYNSKSEYAKNHGHNLKCVLEKTKNGGSHNGIKGWEI